jgi:hypothetical protein
MLSVLSDRLIPEFIRENHPTFEAFMKVWLDHLSEDDGALKHISSLGDYVTADDGTFIESIKSAYMSTYPALPLGNVPATDDAFLIKNLREIYSQKGSEAAYRFFFQAQFGDDISFNYPKENILRTSDGKWQVYKYITINFGAEDIPTIIKYFFNKQIKGRYSNATAFVKVPEGADPTYWIEKGELPLKDVFGVFIPGEVVEVIT